MDMASYGMSSHDSLQALYDSEKTSINERSILSIELAMSYIIRNDEDTAIYYANYGMNSGIHLNIPDAVIGGAYVLINIMLYNDSLVGADSIIEQTMSYIGKAEDKDLALGFLINSAYIYQTQEEYYKARKIYLKGIQIAENEKRYSWLWSLYNNLGTFFNSLEEYDSAVVYLNKSLELHSLLSDSERKFSVASIYSNLGESYLKKDDLINARKYLQLAINHKDLKENNYGAFNAHMNMAEVDMAEGHYESASYHINVARKYLDSLNNDGFIAYLLQMQLDYLTILGKLKFHQKEYLESSKIFDQAITIATKSSELKLDSEVYKMMAEICRIEGDLVEALNYLNLYIESYQEHIKKRYDKALTSLILENNYNIELLQAKKDVEIAKITDSKNKLIYIAVIMTSIGVIGILVFIVLLQKSRLKRRIAENQKAKLEQEIISKELNAKTKELTTSVMYLAKKNEFINLISQKLKLLKFSISNDKQEIITQIIKELDNSSIDDSWKEFETLFMKVNSDFYTSISRSFPHLTSNDLRLCAFIRLNMSNKEISALTFQSVDSLKMARHRLRKKLNLESSENLISFLNKL